MKEIIENIKNEDLDSIPMDHETYINSVEYKNYYQERSSKEHYRLLTFLSFLFNDSKIIDVGSLKGSSALALSTNQNNTVYSFDISNSLDLNHVPSNINFINDEVTSGRYDDLILESKIILLDTYHEGEYEREFLNHLEKLNYKGILICDDIFLNTPMMEFWNDIKQDKSDITKLGHSTGTGIVYFN
jgi:predicted O-methyltransferase YrrM